MVYEASSLVVMLPQHLPQPHMQPWPAITPSLVVGDVIPEWPLWSPLDEAQLLWTEEEAQAYADPRLGTEPRILNVAGKAPTALHSYGNPLQGCPCRCRLQGFSLTRLYNQGLRGYGVPASHSAATRHLHPQELGLLSTIPSDHASCSRAPGSPLFDRPACSTSAVALDRGSNPSMGIRDLPDLPFKCSRASGRSCCSSAWICGSCPACCQAVSLPCPTIPGFGRSKAQALCKLDNCCKPRPHFWSRASSCSCGMRTANCFQRHSSILIPARPTVLYRCVSGKQSPPLQPLPVEVSRPQWLPLQAFPSLLMRWCLCHPQPALMSPFWLAFFVCSNKLLPISPLYCPRCPWQVTRNFLPPVPKQPQPSDLLSLEASLGCQLSRYQGCSSSSNCSTKQACSSTWGCSGAA